ncbi:MAG TPA: response regulator [Thermoguttaceae bacterium]|nr:response regulator [Thermoguttaceae bacterium]
MSSEPTVFVVDDDPQGRKSVCALVRSMGIPAESFASAEEFLEAYLQERPGCLVTDVRMFGMSGLELQEELKRRNVLLPAVVLTAYARTPITVRAMKAGAVTLLEKPYDDDDLWDAIRAALTEDSASRADHQQRRKIRDRIARLTPAERKVMDMMVQGKANKAIAHELDISVRTVENRRREVFAKLQADSVAQLVRLAIEADSNS